MRLSLIVAVVAALFAATSSAPAAEIITTAISGAQTRSTVVLHARRIDRKADPIERSIVVPGTSSVELPDGVWEIRIDGAALWGPRIYARAADSVVLPLWPAGVLHGTMKDPAPALTLQFTALGEAGPSGEADCSVDGQAWSCKMPLGRYDLRFSTAGFAPEYRFGLSVPGSQPTPIQFTAGASLSGSVEAVRGVKVPLDALQVRLTSTGGKAQQQYTTTANAKGFFQFKGLAPGEYTVTAIRSGLVAQRRGVTIKSGMAAQLSAPLLLDRPKRLSVTILPMLDPEARPWVVALSAYSADHGQSSLLSQSSATSGGEWTAPALLAGDYAVQISRANGQTWKWQDVTVADADVELPLAVLGERITGVITLGERPLAAKLSFGGEHGSSLVSDDTGHFEGEIPPEDSDERTVSIETESAQVVRTVRVKLERTESGQRRVTIKLAATTLFGRVTHEDGSPAPYAIVTVNASRDIQQVIAQADGAFQLQGLEPGEYRVLAETASAKSERMPVQLADSEPAELNLIVRDQLDVRGRVLMGGMPVIGASVYAMPDVQWAPFMPHTTTADAGEFALQLPSRTSTYDLVLVHPAFDTVLTRIPAQPSVTRQIVATQTGGTLTVESAAPADVLVRHAGGQCWLAWLAKLSASGGSVGSSRIVLPRLEAGDYAVCSSALQRCAAGYLPPYGTLSLTLREND